MPGMGTPSVKAVTIGTKDKILWPPSLTDVC